jgi:micrococcal nuclease
MGPSYVYRAQVVRVIDGDTIVADVDVGFDMAIRKHLRLLRVDTSELNSPIEEDREHARMAKVFVEESIPPSTKIVVKTEKGDSFGRYLAEVYYRDLFGQELNISDELVRLGLGKEYR